MLSENSMFYYLTGENENSCTQILANMMQTRFVRDIVLRFLCENSIGDEILNSIESNDISTQMAFAENGRPDIVIHNNNCSIFIEDKTSNITGLTQNQPEGYFKEIKGQGGNRFKRICFLIPEEYVHKEELKKRIEALESEAKSNNIVITIRKWSDLFEELSKQQISSKSHVFAECLNYLSYVVDKKPVEDSTILTASETALLYQPDRIITLYEKIKNIKNAAENAIKYTKDSQGLDFEIRDWQNICRIGKSLYRDNELEIFIGLNPNIESQYLDYSYSIVFWYNKKLEEICCKGQIFKPYTPDEKERDGYWTFYKLDKTLFSLDRQDDLNSTVNDITQEVLKELK